MADKQILVQYVHDAVEMEVRKHTVSTLLISVKQHLNAKLEDIFNKGKTERKPYQKKKNELEAEKDQLENPNENQVIQNCIKQINNLKYSISIAKLNKLKFRSAYLPVAIICSCVCFFALLALHDIFEDFFMNRSINEFYSKIAQNEGIIFVFAPVLGSIAAVIPTIFIVAKKNNKARIEYTDSQKRKQYQLCELEQQLERYKSAEAQKDLERKNRLAEIHIQIQQINDQIEALYMQEINEQSALQQFVNEQISSIEHSIETVNRQMCEFYSLNLIPPDYRSLECVIAFDQMFRNDLVDNMREAALLYDERVFRGEMIKGLDNIYNSINNLGALMSETVAVLRSIESNTERMCDELMDISSNLVRMNANVTGHLSTISSNLESGLGAIADSQNSIASEFEYSRYANDAIRANSDRMIWYAEQRRQGLL